MTHARGSGGQPGAYTQFAALLLASFQCTGGTRSKVYYTFMNMQWDRSLISGTAEAPVVLEREAGRARDRVRERNGDERILGAVSSGNPQP